MPTTSHAALVAQLRDAVRESGLTQEQIAIRAEMNVRTVYRALYGQPINTATLLRLLFVLRKTVKIVAA